MSSRSATIAAEEVGQVHIPVTLTSYVDFMRARAGELSAAEVRSVELGPILADTGATNLCLPAGLIAELGLGMVDEVLVETAGGVMPARLFGGLIVTVDGRSRQIGCLELPGGGVPLLGAIPMEELGIELDLRARTYWLRPDDTRQTYITA